MKNITLILLLFSLLSFQKGLQEIKLHGNYKMEFEPEFAAHNCNIKIRDNKYVRTLDNGKKIKGEINVLKRKFGQLFIVKEKDSDLEIHIEGSTYRPSDTIFFKTKKLGQEENNDVLTIYSGKLIKLK